MKEIISKLANPSINQQVTNTKSCLNNPITTPKDACDDCWGSGWGIQFIKPCTTCKGTGKKSKFS